MEPATQPQPKAEETGDFFKYPSIENTSNTKGLSKIRRTPIVHNDVLWAALEKIHGANFSIACTPDSAIYSSRNHSISNPIPIPCNDVTPFFIEKFFGCEKLVAKFHNQLQDLHVLLQERYPGLTKYYLYGELFGGFWPLGANEGTIHVQKGVYYTPSHEFFVFDCFVEGPDFKLWLTVKDVIGIVGQVLKVVPIHKTGTFEQMLMVDSVINSTIPKLLGLDLKILSNVCEGVIIRPYDNPKRIILKKKNKEFLETVDKKAAEWHEVKALKNTERERVLSEILNYFNDNRIDSAYSKMPDSNVKELADEIISDMLNEAAKDEVKFNDAPEVKSWVDKELKIRVLKRTAQYIANNRTEGVGAAK